MSIRVIANYSLQILKTENLILNRNTITNKHIQLPIQSMGNCIFCYCLMHHH